VCHSLCHAYRCPPSPPSLVGPSPRRFLAVPPIHPASRGSQQWWVVWLLCCALLVRCLHVVHVVVIIPPVFHPTSSCSWDWGWVVCHPLSLVPLCLSVGRFTSVPVVFCVGVSVWAILCWLLSLVVVQTVKIQVYTFS
jgi:hypothetical protein